MCVTLYSFELKAMSKQKFIENLYKENSTFSSTRQAEMVANLLDTVSSDIYSESQRFVFELIQNADDAAKNTNNIVYFDFLSNSLIVSHNGEVFSEIDINSLTTAGASTKRGDSQKTGYKGIGFKSVFGKSERVTIFSDGYQFRFDKSAYTAKVPWQIIPIWTELKDLTNEDQRNVLKNEYAVSTIIEIKNVETLLKDLNDLLNNGQILLFLRRVSKISVSNNGELITTIEKKINNQNTTFDEVTLYKDEKKISSWLTKTFEKISIPSETKDELRQDDKTPEKLKEAGFTELSFAAKIEDGKLRSLKKEESLIFTYLPTKVSDFEFPFLVNGSFLTNAAREGLHEDRIWNQWLFKLTAEKILDWLEILAKSTFKFHILQLLPSKFNSGFNRLKNSFDESLEKKVKEKVFIPTKSLVLKKISDIVIDKTGLSELSFISSNTVIQFINQAEKTNFQIDSFINEQLQRTDKLRSFGAKFFDMENLEAFFLSDIFIKNHQPTENFELIEYFYNKASKEETKEWNEKLKAIPFIYAKGKKLKSPQSVCFPSVAFETEFGDEVTVIHNTVYPKIESNNKIKSWLEILGVKEPSDLAYLENEIIGNIENCITKDNYLRVTRYLFNQHKKSLLTELHYDQLQSLKLFVTTKEFIPANQCFLSDVYEPQLTLEKVNNVCKFVSETYKQVADYSSEWKTFFLRIGVVENVELHEVRLSATDAKHQYSMFSIFFTENATQKYKSNAGNIYHNPIITYSFTIHSLIEFATEYTFAKLFWEKVVKTNFIRNNDDKGLVAQGWQNKRELNENLFDWCIENAEIFPSTLKKCHKATDLFINDKEIIDIAGQFLPVFDYQEPLTNYWREVLPFKSKLELGDYLAILEKIAEEAEENEVLRKYNKRKIGLIYNKLASLLSDFSEDKKATISDWSNKNKLLSSNGRFELANELMWIKIDGFTTASEKLKILELPDNSKSNTKTFEELISLFQVQIIDKFIPAFENDTRDIDLHYKLQSILPYFAAIIETKQYTDYKKEFERLFAIVSKAEFFHATSITLSFTHISETIEGPSLNVFRESNKLYFKSKWRSPIIMFNLIPELSNLMEITGLNDELRLLLELDESETIEWLSGLGYDLANIKAKPEYQKAKQKIKVKPSQKIYETKEIISVVTESEVDEYEVIEIENSEPEYFVPVSTPKEIDTLKISVIKKNIFNITPITNIQYSEIQNKEVREDIGIWSETLVHEYLTNNKGDFTEIIWMNESGESELPYDFKVIENGIEKFIDVKGTPSSSKNVVYLSENEWKFMFNKMENYSIYRVYNAGQLTARIEFIENPGDKIIKGEIFPNPITLQI